MIYVVYISSLLLTFKQKESIVDHLLSCKRASTESKYSEVKQLGRYGCKTANIHVRFMYVLPQNIHNVFVEYNAGCLFSTIKVLHSHS